MKPRILKWPYTRQFIVLWCLLGLVPNLLKAQNSDKLFQSMPPTQRWEEAESKKIYSKAMQLIEQNQRENAAKLLQEIVEFFPNTTHWADACIQLSSLLLIANRERSESQQYLDRLEKKATHSKKAKRSILVAYWNFFIKGQKIKDLLEWLKLQPDSDLQILRDQKGVHKDYLLVLQKKSPQRLLDILVQLKHKKPLTQLLNILDQSQHLMKPEEELWLLQISLNSLNHQLLKRTSHLLMQRGRHESIDLLFQKNKSASWTTQQIQLWTETLIHRRLFDQALKLIRNQEDPNLFLKEKILIYIGQEKWTDSIEIAIQNSTWFEENFNWDEIKNMIQQWHREAPTRHSSLHLLEQLKEGPLNLLLKAELLERKDLEAAKTLLKTIRQDYPIHGDQALFLLAQIHRRQGNQQFDLCRQYLNELVQEYPQSNLIAEAKDILENLKLIQPK